MHSADPVLEQRIEDFVSESSEAFDKDYRIKGDVYVIKYLPPARLGGFLATSKRLYASDVPGYTWGAGVYLAPLAAPLTTMMYGRVGIVGRIDPKRIFDATGVAGQTLYQAWIRYQWQWFNLLTTTIHSSLANRYLRNAFKERFRLDCVVFKPDQFCPGYVLPNSDVWFAVTHWMNGRPAAGVTTAIMSPEWCVVGCEEFSAYQKDLVFDALLGQAFRGARLSRRQIRSMSPRLAGRILAKYRGRLSNPNDSILVVTF